MPQVLGGALELLCESLIFTTAEVGGRVRLYWARLGELPDDGATGWELPCPGSRPGLREQLSYWERGAPQIRCG